uniref:Bm9743 n=1 Tax=Brugia malayi TaxID=6279 RepID=A0A0J9XTV0_BRUMA|nr:Bm9743 [Brugia malayi]
MPWCAEIRPVLSRLRWCDASSDVDEDAFKKVVWKSDSALGNSMLKRSRNAAVDISSAYPDCWRVDENSFYHTFLLGRAKTERDLLLWEWPHSVRKK